MSIGEIRPDDQKMAEFLKRYQGEDPKANNGIPVKAGKNELQKDDFTKLMFSELKHQDPLNPMDNKEMGRQLAQMASLEQLQNLNKGLEMLRHDQKPLGRMNLVGLIGQNVDVDLGRIDHVKGNDEEVNFRLPKGAHFGEFSVVNSAGEVVYKKGVPLRGAEDFKFKWNGKEKNGADSAGGTYIITANIENEAGVSIPYQTSTSDKVKGLDFRGNQAVLILDNGNRVEFSQIKSIGVEGDKRGSGEQVAKQEEVLDPTKPMVMVNGQWRNSGKKSLQENYDESPEGKVGI